MVQNPAERRYLVRFIPLMVAYVAIIFAVSFWFRGRTDPGPLAYALSVLPAIPVVGVIWAMGRYLVEEQDEYLRQKQVRAILWATGVTVSVCTVWGFLQAYDLVPNVPLYWVFVLFCGGLGLGKCVTRLRGA